MKKEVLIYAAAGLGVYMLVVITIEILRRKAEIAKQEQTPPQEWVRELYDGTR